MNLHNHYSSLNYEQKRDFINEVQTKCKVGYPTVRSWIAPEDGKLFRNPKPVYKTIIAKIVGIPEKELFKTE